MLRLGDMLGKSSSGRKNSKSERLKAARRLSDVPPATISSRSTASAENAPPEQRRRASNPSRTDKEQNVTASSAAVLASSAGQSSRVKASRRKSDDDGSSARTLGRSSCGASGASSTKTSAGRSREMASKKSNTAARAGAAEPPKKNNREVRVNNGLDHSERSNARSLLVSVATATTAVSSFDGSTPPSSKQRRSITSGSREESRNTIGSACPVPSPILCPPRMLPDDGNHDVNNTNRVGDDNNGDEHCLRLPALSPCTSAGDATCDTTQDDTVPAPNNTGTAAVATANFCPFARATAQAPPQYPHQQQLKQLETGEKLTVELSEIANSQKAGRHTVGCTSHECHGSIMEKKGFEAVSDSYSQSIDIKIQEATEFIQQFASETKHLPTEEDVAERMAHVVNDIRTYGTYRHTTEELEFGCRLAWRNSGRCIMRKVAFNLELRDCRSVKTAEDCYNEIVDHLKYAGNGGAIKPVISVFPQKGDGISAPVRIWNRQLVGYAAYKRRDGTVMGDPVNLEFTALCVKLGWATPSTKSDFDVLPLVLSDNIRGHDRPQIFELPPDAVLEVPIHHPEHELFSTLNLRWYALPAISNMGVDIGGVYYQTCPFNGWYAVTEIARDFLDKQRYDLADAVAIACNIPRTKLDVWRDDVQLQMHRAILHSFAKASVSLVDHHTASDSFLSFYKDEIKERKKCPADWVWLVPPAGGSMTSVFHQEMVNFILKPLYRPNVDIVADHGISLPDPIVLDEECKPSSAFNINKKDVVYDMIVLCYGSETGTSHRFVTRLASDLDGLEDVVTGPIPLDDLPSHLPTPRCKGRTLVLIAASTTGVGGAPSHAKMFLQRMEDINAMSGSIHNTSFAVFALGNSAYTQSFCAFGYNVHLALESVGALPVLNVKVGDELMDQETSFNEWRQDVLSDETGIIYNGDVDAYDLAAAAGPDQASEKMVKLYYQGFAQVINSDTRSELDKLRQETKQISWSRYSSMLGRSTDLFSFQVAHDQSSTLDDLRPGDHIALYPKNLDDAVDLCIRMMNPGSYARSDLRGRLKSDIDLARPVSTTALAELWEMTENERARYVIASMLRRATRDETDESVVDLINQLPPGSIPCDWMLTSAPPMDPRFYSIASISLEERTVSICQSVYTFPSGQAGTTSRWLRSLKAEEEAFGVFSQTDLHLPSDEDSPALMFATGTGIAPFRSFWMSQARNPMYLFFGCRNKQELPFASEIESLKRAGRIHPFIAYSREMSNKLYVQDMITAESDTVLSLLHNFKAHIYICGSPDMASSVKDRLLMVLCAGNGEYPAMKMSQAMEKLVIMKYRKRFITEVYGTLSSNDDAMSFAWKEATGKIVEMMSGLGKLTLPRPRVEEEFKPIRPKRSSWDQEFRPECAGKYTCSGEDVALDVSRLPVSSVLANSGNIRRTESLQSIAENPQLVAQKSGDDASTNALHSSLPAMGYEQEDAPAPFIPPRPRLSRRESWRGTFAPEFSGSDSDIKYFGPGNRRGSDRSLVVIGSRLHVPSFSRRASLSGGISYSTSNQMHRRYSSRSSSSRSLQVSSNPTSPIDSRRLSSDSSRRRLSVGSLPVPPLSNDQNRRPSNEAA